MVHTVQCYLYDKILCYLILFAGENVCPTGSTCQTYETVFGNATHMCEVIWNRSYTVVPDSESCMVLWFDGTQRNPNEEVRHKMVVCEA